jgi:hypothetical protein
MFQAKTTTYQNENNRNVKTHKTTTLPKGLDGYEEIKIGALVQSTFPELINKNLLNDETLRQLMDGKYSKTTFGLNFPVLIRINDNENVNKQRYIGNYARYYKNRYVIKNKKYYLTSQWYEISKTPYLKWLKSLNK